MSLSSPPPDWMVLLCSACGTRMKVRREVALTSRLICPGCRVPLPAHDAPSFEVEEADPTPLPPPAAGGSLPQHRESPVLQGTFYPSGTPAAAPARPGEVSSQEEFDGRSADDPEGEDDELPLPPGQRRRVKIKKRRIKRPTAALRYLELTDWDQHELTQIPDAEIAADVWAEAQPIPEEVAPSQQENEYLVESSEEEDGQTRTTKKRVRRRRLLQGTRLFFRRFTSLSRYFTAALAVLLAGVAFYGFYVFRQQYQPPPLPPVTEPAIDRSMLTRYDELGAEQAVRDFLSADSIESKLAFVRHPGRIRPLMQAWYRGSRSAGRLEGGKVAKMEKWGGTPGSTSYYITLAMPVFVPDPLTPGSTLEEMTFFAVEEIRNGPVSTYLIDWETSTGYQEMPLETYKATMPSEPHLFRIYMKADNYYNHGFSELDWQCVALYYPGRDFHLYGYISRTSLEGRTLLPLVEAGRSAGIIAELVYPADPVSRDQVIVRQLRHYSWFYDKPEDAVGDPAPIKIN